MPVSTDCPKCGKAMRIDADSIGQSVRCPSCREKFSVASVKFSEGDTADAAALRTVAPSSPSESPSRPLARASAAPKSVGRFQLKQPIGQGGFGVVYLAWDPELSREVALKIPRFSSNEKSQMKRFAAEARAAARLRHPHIVAVFDAGTIGNQPFIAYEFIQGESLAARLKREPIPVDLATRWVRQLAEALAYAHGEGIVHRDIKPENVLLNDRDQPQILDFGLAKQVNQDSSMTTEGSVLGTPAYMSPEQARGEISEVGPLSDQYSLGVVLYELLTGQKPFEGLPHVVIAKVASEEPANPASLIPGLPRDLVAICNKAMNKEAGQRYPSCVELAADLEHFLLGEPTLARPVTNVERARRWCRRNPLVASLWSAIALTVVIGAGISTALAIIANHRAGQLSKTLTALQQETEKAQKLTAESQAEAARAHKATKLAKQHQQRAEDALKKMQEAQEKTKLAEQQAREKTRAAMSAEEAASKARLNERKQRALVDAQTAKLNLERRQRETVQHGESFRQAREALKIKDFTTAQSLLESIPTHLRQWEWGHLYAQVSTVRSTSVHVPQANLAFSGVTLAPTGKSIAVAYHNRFAIWTPDGKCPDFPLGEILLVRSPPVYSSDEKLLAISSPNRVVIHNLQDATAKLRPLRIKGQVLGFVDGPEKVVIFRSDNVVAIHDATSGRELNVLTIPLKYPLVLDRWPGLLRRSEGSLVYPDLSNVSRDKTDGSFELVYSQLGKTAKAKQSSRVPVSPMKPVAGYNWIEGQVAVAPNGSHYAICRDDGQVTIKTFDAGNAGVTFFCGAELARSLNWSPNGRWLSCVASDGRTRVIDALSGEVLLQVPGSVTRTSQVSNDGLTVLADSRRCMNNSDPQIPENSGGLTLWTSIQGGASSESVVLPKVKERITAIEDATQGNRYVGRLCFTRDARRVHYGPPRNGVNDVGVVWDLAAQADVGRTFGALSGDGHVAVTIEVSPKGPVCVARDVATNQIISSTSIDAPGAPNQSQYPSTVVSNDGGWAWVGLDIVDLKAGKILIKGAREKSIQPWPEETNRQAISPDGLVNWMPKRGPEVQWYKVICNKGLPERVQSRVVSFEALLETGSIQLHQPLACSPDGLKLIVSSSNSAGTEMNLIQIKDDDDGWSLIRKVGEPLMGIRGVRFSPDGLRIATCGDDATVRLWDVVTGNVVHQFSGLDAGGWDIAFSPNGDRLVLLQRNGVVRTWHAMPLEIDSPAATQLTTP